MAKFSNKITKALAIMNETLKMGLLLQKNKNKKRLGSTCSKLLYLFNFTSILALSNEDFFTAFYFYAHCICNFGIFHILNLVPQQQLSSFKNLATENIFGYTCEQWFDRIQLFDGNTNMTANAITVNYQKQVFNVFNDIATYMFTKRSYYCLFFRVNEALR